MAPRKKKPENGKAGKRPIEQYDHKDKTRVNNPQVGLVTPRTDPVAATHKSYFYDPHLDPRLEWAGKKERLSFDVPTVSLHVHERIDPRTIVEAVRRRNGNGRPVQGYLFESREENPPLRDAIDFYRHPHGWSNRLIAGDSLLVMNSLLEKEGMAGQVQMVYFDPPYGIKYGSNFQPFVNQREVKDGRDEDLTAEPEMIKAFRDAWELGIHSYLSYLSDRLKVARELLDESGSIFVQISDQNVHHVREITDAVFGNGNFVVSIVVKKKSATTITDPVNDFVLWYAKDKSRLRVRRLFESKSAMDEDSRFDKLLFPDGTIKRAADCEAVEVHKEKGRFFNDDYPLVSQDEQEGRSSPFIFKGQRLYPGKNRHWTFDPEKGMTFLTAQMNADLLTDDLKKKRSSNQSFWLVGRPDVDLRHLAKGEDKGKWQAEVRGFDYYNTRTGTIESGDTSKIAMWLLDTDYDGRSLYPRQVFFPMADEEEGWARLARNLKAEIDPELIEAYRGTISLPFALGAHKRVALKVMDDRGIESLKVIHLG